MPILAMRWTGCGFHIAEDLEHYEIIGRGVESQLARVGHPALYQLPQTGGIDRLQAFTLPPTAQAAGGGVDLIRKITTYPVLLSGPLEGKQVHVGRVALHECLTCGHLMPTPAGQAKVDRNVEMGIRLFLGQLHRSAPAHAPTRLPQTHYRAYSARARSAGPAVSNLRFGLYV